MRQYTHPTIANSPTPSLQVPNVKGAQVSKGIAALILVMIM